MKEIDKQEIPAVSGGLTAPTYPGPGATPPYVPSPWIVPQAPTEPPAQETVE